MEKKNYVKPSMRVVKLARRPLLVDSDPVFGGSRRDGNGD